MPTATLPSERTSVPSRQCRQFCSGLLRQLRDIRDTGKCIGRCGAYPAIAALESAAASGRQPRDATPATGSTAWCPAIAPIPPCRPFRTVSQSSSPMVFACCVRGCPVRGGATRPDAIASSPRNRRSEPRSTAIWDSIPSTMRRTFSSRTAKSLPRWARSSGSWRVSAGRGVRLPFSDGCRSASAIALRVSATACSAPGSLHPAGSAGATA